MQRLINSLITSLAFFSTIIYLVHLLTHFKFCQRLQIKFDHVGVFFQSDNIKRNIYCTIICSYHFNPGGNEFGVFKPVIKVKPLHCSNAKRNVKLPRSKQRTLTA